MPHWDESLVDDEVERERLDSRGVLRALATAGAQVRAAVGLSQEAGIDRVAGGERPRGGLVAAVGGSAVARGAPGTVAGPGAPAPLGPRSFTHPTPPARALG